MDRVFETIYVYLKNEGVDVWRPVMAERLMGEVFRIVSVNEAPDDERWQFKTEEIVRCELRKLSARESGMVAVERHSGTI